MNTECKGTTFLCTDVPSDIQVKTGIIFFYALRPFCLIHHFQSPLSAECLTPVVLAQWQLGIVFVEYGAEGLEVSTNSTTTVRTKMLERDRAVQKLACDEKPLLIF
jgi:hypothetical protein